ncbi:MAG: hypothetical protein JWN43_2041 [Gammaproteobacteria bacterium]|nr:hypothetical protein [Gammaproteobacteria bacterium]
MTRIEVPKSSVRRGSSRRGTRLVAIILLLLIGGLGLWTWLTLAWSYAEGERAGVLQRFVRRGWLCKTQEGEIALYYGGGQYLGPGTSAQVWDFSVRDTAVAAQLSKAVGHRVQLHYTEHPGVPTPCFAETRFYVDRVTVTDEPAANQPNASGASPRAVPDVRPGTTLAPPPPPPAAAP